MKLRFRYLARALAVWAITILGLFAADSVYREGQWTKLFDGKTLSGWTSPDPGEWSVDSEGVLHGRGKVSHLFSPGTYTNFEFKAEIKLAPNSNSGMYFRARYGKGWPRGYEAQLNNSYVKDPKKTGSLYNYKNITEQLVPDDTWWTQHIIAVGKRIIIKVNGKIVVDHLEEKNTHQSGHLAFQQHDPGSHVMIRNVMVKPLPSDEAAAWDIVRKETPEIKPSAQ